MSVDLDERLHDTFEAAARRVAVSPPPALETIQRASSRRTRRVEARRRLAGASLLIVVLVLGLVVLRSPKGSDVDTATVTDQAPGRPVRIGLSDPSATVVWAADESQVQALRRARPNDDVSVPWMGVYPHSFFVAGPLPSTTVTTAGGSDGSASRPPDAAPTPSLVPSVPGASVELHRYRARPGDPTSPWFEIDTLTATSGPGVRSPWPTPKTGTVEVNGGVGWFQPNPVDLLMFAWRTPGGDEGLIHAFGLSRDQIVDLARSAVLDGSRQLVPTRIPTGFERQTARSPEDPPPPFSKVEYRLPGSQSAEITTMRGDQAMLDRLADSSLLMAVRVDIATIRGHKALITSNGGQDFTVVWSEPENGMVVQLHAITRVELLPEILGHLAVLDPTTWRTMTTEHSPKAELYPKTADRMPSPGAKTTEVTLPPSAG